jgi:hypothetical protein
MSNAKGSDGAYGATKPKHGRSLTGVVPREKELAKLPEETLALWEKYVTEETDGSYLILQNY